MKTNMPIGIYERSEEQKEFARKIGKLYGGKKRILKDRTCPVCKNIFRPYNSLTKHCSYKCSIKNKPKKGLNKICTICGKEYYVMQCFKYSKYCSRGCQFKSITKPESKIKLRCKFCKKEYIRERSELKGRGSSWCSMICAKAFRKMKQYKNKKHNKTSGAKLKKTLWTIFSLYIRQRDEGICISCGKKEYWRKTDAGHYIPKTAGLSIYFDERNVNCQCTYCNRWMHGNLSKYAIALRKKYGENILEELDMLRNQQRKISVMEYKKLIEEYKVKMLSVSKDKHLIEEYNKLKKK